MKRFPLIRIKLSNEYIMAMLFVVLLLYQVPHWLNEPLRILIFLSVLSIGLLFDLILSFRKMQMVKCSVSASVTVGIIFAIYPNITFWSGFLAIIFGLFFGKFLFGITGKNIFNPAIVGVLLLTFLNHGSSYIHIEHNITLVALVLSIPFAFIRPYPVIGFATGIMTSMYLGGNFNIESIISTGLIIWCCLIITDPVTISPRPIMGVISGVLGFTVFKYFDGSIMWMGITILSLNLISFLIEYRFPLYNRKHIIKSKIKNPYKKINTPNNNIKTSSQNYIEQEKIHIATKLSKETIIRMIKDNNVRGLGGAGFPTYKKIETFNQSSVVDKYIIINSVECDPGLVHDKWILNQYSDQIEKGIEVIKKCTCVDNILIAIKKSTKKYINNNLNVLEVPDYYPIGGESLLIKKLLGKTIDPTDIPAKEGILVMNIQTVLAIYEAVFCNKYADSKYITIGNIKTKEASIVKVKLGTKIYDYIKPIYDTNGLCIFVGGGLMQSKLTMKDDLIDYSTNFIALSEYPRYKDSYCSKCGICEKRCPRGLQVQKIVNLIESNRFEELQKYHIEKCLSCGICSYYCLAGKNLSGIINSAK